MSDVHWARHKVTFEGSFLERGFWLYIWEVEAPDGTALHYVGRTGDNSSPNAQSPYVRMGQHLGSERPSGNTTNMLRKHLEKAGVCPENCTFRLVAQGPVFPEVEEGGMEGHKLVRDKIAALERDLASAMEQAGYKVMNTVQSKAEALPGQLREVINAFAADFPKLKKQ